MHDDFGGLHRDLDSIGAWMTRRRFLHLAMGASLVPLLPWRAAAGESEGGDCSRIPEESAGPFQGRTAGGPPLLSQDGIVRSDIRSSFGGMAGTAEGVPMTLTLLLVSAADCRPLPGRAIYVWQCDREGKYSLYSEGATEQNYLRGMQETDENGNATFASIFPACYSGRWPHVHFEVYESLAAAAKEDGKVVTSQVALPEGPCNAVYATKEYGRSAANLKNLSLANDFEFHDGAQAQVAATMGDPAKGFTATLLVPV
jgi:protocatechuate 3,4-dioxygenase beta subunit